MKNRRYILLLAGLALPLGAHSQEPAPTPPAAVQDAPAELSSLLDRAYPVVEYDGRLRAFGPGYAGWFDRDGLEFVPVLGRGAPRTARLRLRFAGVERGGSAWPGDPADVAPEVGDDGMEVLYRRAAGLVERYEIRRDGIEQSFVFPTPIRGSGDLVVRVQVDTDLRAPTASAAGEGLTFGDTETGGVRIGGVTGIDAAGRRQQGSLRLRGDRIELVLPHAFVESAQYPLVVDPLIGGQGIIGGTGNDLLDPTVSYERFSDRYLVVFRRDFSLAGSEILGLFLRGSSGTVTGSPIPIGDPADPINESPAIGTLRQGRVFFVAWLARPFHGAPAALWVRAVRAADGVRGPGLLVTNDSASPPDLASSIDDRTLITWKTSTQSIRLLGLAFSSSNLVVGPGFAVTCGTASGSGRPRISQNGGAPSRHVVAWNARTGVFAVTSTRDPRTVSAAVTVSTLGGLGAPDVDGDGTDFLVTFARPETPGATTRNIVARKLHFDGTALSLPAPLFDIAATPSVDETDPAVGYLGPKYLVCWTEATNLFRGDIVGIALGADECVPCGLEFRLSGVNRTHQFGAAIGTKAATQFGDECMIVYHDAEAAPPFTSNVATQRFEAQGSGGRVTDHGGGCGLGGSTLLVGDPALGNRQFAIKLSGATASIAVLNFSVAGGGAVQCGNCSFMLPLFSSLTMTVNQGRAVQPFPIGCDPALLGGGFDVQWISVATTSIAPCPGAPQVQVSNRVGFTFGL